MSCIEFYERCLKENYDATNLSIIITIFAYENREFSYQISLILLKGLNRVNYEESKPYLEVIYYFLSIPDGLVYSRIEWVLGFPQPLLNKFDGFALTYGLEEASVDYRSSLLVDAGTSYLNVLFQNRKKWENLCMVCLHKFLLLLNASPAILEYVLYLPPPCALYAKFTDWFKPFITGYLADCKYGYASVYSSFNKEELATNALNLYQSLEEKINLSLQKSTIIKEEAIQLSLFPIYLIGKTIKEEKIFEDKVGEKNGGDVNLTCYETTVYYTYSKPTGETNKAFPDEIIKENAFNCREIDPISNVYNFIQFKLDEKSVAGAENSKTQDNEHEASDIMPIGYEIKLEETKEIAPPAKEEENNDTLLKKKLNGK